MAAKKKTEEVEQVVEDTEATEVVSSDEAVNEDTTSEEVIEAPTAKAGKRSKKALAEAEAEDKRKESAAAKPEAPKVVRQPPNPLKQHGKGYRKALEMIDKTKEYDLAEAIELAQKTSVVKFDASLEMHINLGVDPKQADQMVRSSVVLPAGTGKSLRVAVLASPDKQAAAKKAGADLVGEDDLMSKIEKGQLDFDMLIATPDLMPKLGKLAKVLGPKGLMPNPKSGTVTADVVKAVEQAKAGKVEFRIDKQAIIHQPIGKVSFKSEALGDNARTLINAVIKAKPAATKGTYVKAISIASTMGPGIKIGVTKAMAEANPKK